MKKLIRTILDYSKQEKLDLNRYEFLFFVAFNKKTKKLENILYYSEYNSFKVNIPRTTFNIFEWENRKFDLFLYHNHPTQNNITKKLNPSSGDEKIALDVKFYHNSNYQVGIFNREGDSIDITKKVVKSRAKFCVDCNSKYFVPNNYKKGRWEKMKVCLTCFLKKR